MRSRLYFYIFIYLLTISNLVFANTDFNKQPEIKKFIHQMVKKHHFKEKSLNELFASVKQRPSALQQIKMPLEKQPWFIYRILFVTNGRIKDGIKFWERNQDLLTKAEKIYGVPANIIVATIGIETKYGENVGNYRVIDALTNLAFSSSPRAKFFKYQLEEFLLLTREQHLNPYLLKGSYAGAMGQLQFMPDSYRHYAASFAHKKHIDLYHNEADIIASVANYYHRHGWITHQPIAKLLKKNETPIDKTHFVELQNYFTKEQWETYKNFNVIKNYNASDLYAMAVYLLGHRITELKGKTNAT